MKTHVIQLERFDDIISTKDRISWAKAPRVLLVWPRRGRIMRRMSDLVILDRYCQKLGAQLALVTWDDVVIQNADGLGIPLYESVEKAQVVSWRRSSKRSLRSLNRRIPHAKSFQELCEETRPDESAERSKSSLPVRLASFLLGVGAVAVLFLFLVPSAEISLDFPTTTQELDLDIWASPKITTANISGGIPAYPVSVTVEGRDTIRSTGTLSLPLSVAEGTVIFTNLTEEEISIPAGTVVLTIGEPSVRFETTRNILLSAGVGETAGGSIQAVVPGVPGNVEAGTIVAMEGDLGLKMLVENQEPTSGGADQVEPSPNETDVNKLRAALLQNLQDSAVSEITAMLSPGQQILSSQVVLQETLEETFEPGLDQPADQLSLKMRVVFTGLYYEQKDVDYFAELSLNSILPERHTAIPGTLRIVEIQESNESIQDDSQRFHWQVQASRQIQELAPENLIKNQVTGQKPVTAIQLLEKNFNLERAPEIVLSPNWWPRLPYFFMRIKVVER